MVTIGSKFNYINYLYVTKGYVTVVADGDIKQFFYRFRPGNSETPDTPVRQAL